MMHTVLVFLCAFFPVWIIGIEMAINYVQIKDLRSKAAKELRYLDALAMLTAEEKREIGIE